MKTIASALFAACLMAGCISSSNPEPPAKNTTVVVPNSGMTVVCQDALPLTLELSRQGCPRGARPARG